MKTYMAKTEEVVCNWFVIDANGKTLGRLASAIAKILRGKHKPIFTPHADTGDFVIVINVDKIQVTGRKAGEKVYYRHSGYPGGLKEETFEKLLNRAPSRVLELAVKGMLPKGPLGRRVFRKLKIYTGAEHPHAAQQPQALDL